MGCPRLLMRLAAVAGLVTGMTFVTQTFANPLAWITFSPAADHADQTQSDLRRRVVDYGGKEQPRTILIDTANTYLYFVVSSGKAIRYAIGVGRDGFTWFGVKIIDRPPRLRFDQRELRRRLNAPRALHDAFVLHDARRRRFSRRG